MKTIGKVLIQFENVTLGYRRHVVARDVSFTISEGEFVGIVGPNGSGKTTIVRAMLGILRPQGGVIRISGQSSSRLRIGYVPQRDSIDPIMPFTVFDVVMMGRYGRLGPVQIPTASDRNMTLDALAHVDLADLASTSYRDLSGGQKQRALIARALAAEPDILILDEPTNGMDLASRITILDLIKHFHSEHGMTVVMISHLLSDVANVVKKIMLVEPRFFQVGSVEEILSEENLRRIYDMPVTVGEWMDTKVIIARGKSV
jgi:ABC-type Mn2+/Zn2+ transport system ATPase subunit